MVSKDEARWTAQFLNKVRASLNESAQALDDATLSRLREARQRAVARAGKKRLLGFAPLQNDWLIPAGAFASVVATVVALSLLAPQPDAIGPLEIDDLELLTSTESLDFYQELEFYQWIASENSTG